MWFHSLNLQPDPWIHIYTGSWFNFKNYALNIYLFSLKYTMIRENSSLPYCDNGLDIA